MNSEFAPSPPFVLEYRMHSKEGESYQLVINDLVAAAAVNFPPCVTGAISTQRVCACVCPWELELTESQAVVF